MSSVREIARRLGVSPATVSRALNNSVNVDPQTRARVIAAANTARYVPNVSKAPQNVIGLVYPGDPVEPDYGGFESALMAGILRGLNELRFDLKIVSISRDKLPTENYSQFFLRKGIRGAILRSFLDTRSVCTAIAAEEYPAIVVADRFEEPKVNFISCNSREDSMRAVCHLMDLGHRRIALAVHRYPDTDHVDRREGYLDAFRTREIDIDSSLMIETIGEMVGGETSILRLMSMPEPPTAVYFTNPLSTIGALKKCHELGIRVPQDLSIVGFDDGDIRYHTFPTCTAVCQDATMMGFESARWLTRMLCGMADVQMRSTRPTRFEINMTTAASPVEPVRVLPDGTRLAVQVGAGISSLAAKSRHRQAEDEVATAGSLGETRKGRAAAASAVTTGGSRRSQG
jgi:DNA-binding LacI/PurR family transcriptional regulator